MRTCWARSWTPAPILGSTQAPRSDLVLVGDRSMSVEKLVVEPTPIPSVASTPRFEFRVSSGSHTSVVCLSTTTQRLSISPIFLLHPSSPLLPACPIFLLPIHLPIIHYSPHNHYILAQQQATVFTRLTFNIKANLHERQASPCYPRSLIQYPFHLS